MVLMINNDEIASLLTMSRCMEALEDAYREQAAGRAVNQLRYDTNMPLLGRPERGARYEFKTMVGILPKAGVAALRMSSTLNHHPLQDGVERVERLYLAPGGTTVGLIHLYSTDTGEPVAIMPDGVIQGMRVGGTYGLAAKYLAKPTASRMGLVGSGWQARWQVVAAALVRHLDVIKVYSPTKAHREAFAAEISEEYGLPIQAVDSIAEAAADVDILTAATNAAGPVITPDLLQPGMHASAVRFEFSNEALARGDVIVSNTAKNFLRYDGGAGPYGTAVPHGPNRWADGAMPLLEDIIAGKLPGRVREDQISLFGGHGLGIQFAAVGAVVYQLATERGVGRQVPTDGFLQTLHT